ncbi:hypothetical protein E4U21_000905 [Claviceps maximensis]|nr:hypothetical protein E4U21_000905 [Claviceps maximensis]
MDEMPGKPLDLDALCSSAVDIQDRFYAQFVGVLAQLHELTFPDTGSLYPDSADEEREIIGPSLYLNENDVAVDTGTRREPAESLHTTMDVIKQLYDILDRAFDMPAVYDDPLYLRLQVFARKSLADLLPKFCNSSPNRQQLALSHGDLRCENILVDEEFRIQAIIDWEWVNILPQQFCVPPVWICGLDHDMQDDTSDPSQLYATRDKIFEAFQRAVAAHDEYNKWLKFWKEDPLRLPISFILRCPHYLVPIYNGFIYPTMYEEPFEEIFPTLFAFDEMLQKKYERQLETSQQLENYLRREGLFVLDEYGELRYSCS